MNEHSLFIPACIGVFVIGLYIVLALGTQGALP